MSLDASSELTSAEQNFVYNLETLGLPIRKAAELSGVMPALASAPHIMQARAVMKNALASSLQVTRNDVITGIVDAIGRAKMLSEPMTEIVGWREISKIMGFDAPKKIDLNVTASIEVIQKQVKTMSDAELVRLLGAGDIIDGDFYEIKDREAGG